MSDRIVAALLSVIVASAAAAQELPDPTERTRRLGAAHGEATSTSWVLESTLVAADRRLAVINDVTVAVGDSVDGAQVMAIDPYSVRLRAEGRVIELKLTADDPKRRAAGGVD